MKVGFTGTRNGMTDKQKAAVKALLEELHPTEALHGGCIGADIDFDEMFIGRPIVVTVYPSNIKSMQGNWSHLDIVRPENIPLVRNATIVDLSELMIATPKGEEVLRSGTWSAIRYARKVKKPLIIVWPNGMTVKERC
jgi:hypothetical protein